MVAMEILAEKEPLEPLSPSTSPKSRYVRRRRPFVKCKQCGEIFRSYREDHICCSRSCYTKIRWKKKRKELKKYSNAYYDKNRDKILQYTADWKSKRRAEKPWIEHLRSAKERATKRGIEYSLSEEWASSHWTGRCELTGLPFIVDRGRNVFSASIDKKDPRGGYTPDNSRFILLGINVFKHDGTDEQMYLMAEALVENRKTKKRR